MSIPLTYRIVAFCLDPAASESFAALAQYLDQSGDSDDLADFPGKRKTPVEQDLYSDSGDLDKQETIPQDEKDILEAAMMSCNIPINNSQMPTPAPDEVNIDDANILSITLVHDVEPVNGEITESDCLNDSDQPDSETKKPLETDTQSKIDNNVNSKAKSDPVEVSEDLDVCKEEIKLTDEQDKEETAMMSNVLLNDSPTATALGEIRMTQSDSHSPDNDKLTNNKIDNNTYREDSDSEEEESSQMVDTSFEDEEVNVIVRDIVNYVGSNYNTEQAMARILDHIFKK